MSGRVFFSGVYPIGGTDVDNHEGKEYRVCFAREPYGVCFCFGQSA